MESLQELSLQILVAAITAIIASILTSWFALRRFYSEKWWDKKAEGYGAILESLHYIRRDFDEEMTALMRNREVPDDRKEELRVQYRAAKDELAKRIDIGQFVISEAAVAVLTTFQKELGPEKRADNWPEYIDGALAATNKALQQMRAIAKCDLERS